MRQNAAQFDGHGWQGMFPGLTASYTASYRAQEYIEDFLRQMQNPSWNGIIKLGTHPHILSALRNEELTELFNRIRHTFSLPGQLMFSPSNNNGIPNEIRLTTVTLTFEIPFQEITLIQGIINSGFDQAILNGAPRKIPISAGLSLGKSWKLLGDFIKHYATAFAELEYLQNGSNLSNEKKEELRISSNAIRFKRLLDLYRQINTVFEEPTQNENKQELQKNLAEFKDLLLNHIHEELGGTEIFEFIETQSPLSCFKAIQEAASLTAPETPVKRETTAQMLDRLLNVPGRAKQIAAAVGEVDSGWAPPTLRLNHRLWNVYKLNDPDAGALKQYSRNQMHGTISYYGMNNDVQNAINDATQRMKKQLKRLNVDIKEGKSYVLLVRQQNTDRHVYSIERFTVQRDWNQWNGHQYPLEARWQERVGLIEIRPVHDGDPTELYNPLRTHGINGIHGTMMEQRVHEAMAENRVHQFHKLSEAERNRLRAEIDRYNNERHHTLMENEGLAGSTLTRDERILSDDTLSDGAKAAIARSRARKVSEELKERQLAPRLARLRTHGDDLTQNPEKFLSPRVHALFSADRIHSTRGLSAREREFYRENYEDGYLDTVEAAVAARQNHFDPKAGAARAHFDASQRLHAGFFDNPGYSVSSGSNGSAVATTDSSYDRLSDALDDYDMRKKSTPQNLNEGPENWEQEYKEAKEHAAKKKEHRK